MYWSKQLEVRTIKLENVFSLTQLLFKCLLQSMNESEIFKAASRDIFAVTN